MILAVIKLDLSPEKREQAIDVLGAMVEPIRAQSGCQRCGIYQDIKNGSIIFGQIWKDRATLYRHLRSELYRNVLEIVEMSDSAPVIKYFTITITEGIEIVESARGESV
jgi:quinol monooxygenase YgiN